MELILLSIWLSKMYHEKYIYQKSNGKMKAGIQGKVHQQNVFSGVCMNQSARYLYSIWMSIPKSICR